MEYQTTLNQFDSNCYYQQPTYQQPLYQQPSYTQTTLDQFSAPNYNISSGPGIYSSDKNYGQFSTGGNLHDTARVDRYNNLYGGHTSVYLPGGEHKSMDW